MKQKNRVARLKARQARHDEAMKNPRTWAADSVLSRAMSGGYRRPGSLNK